MSKQHNEAVRRIRAARVEEGICKMARSHGAATHGALCDACHEKRRIERMERQQKNIEEGYCRFSLTHARPKKGDRCERCMKHADTYVKIADRPLTPEQTDDTIGSSDNT